MEGVPVAQVIVGSSANSSFRDLMIAARAMEGRHCHPDVSFEINPGSCQALLNLTLQGGVLNLIKGGARIHQSGCLGCIGMGQAPATGTVSLRTFPRNFPGRSGTVPDSVYLCSPETAVASAIFGRITDPRKLGECPGVCNPSEYLINDENLLRPSEDPRSVEIIMGPNIKPFPKFSPLKESLEATVVIKVGDNITTDHIMPAGSKILPLRSNIEAISEFVFVNVDPDFASRAKKSGDGIVVGGENYGQGSSREHAAIAPRYLGIKAKIAKSFARIHKANLINFGIIPLTLKNPEDYEGLKIGQTVIIEDIREALELGLTEIEAQVSPDNRRIVLELSATDRDRRILVAGGLLNLAEKDF